MDTLAQLAKKHGSVGADLLHTALAEASSGFGAYCWINGKHLKWREFLAGSAAQL